MKNIFFVLLFFNSIAGLKAQVTLVSPSSNSSTGVSVNFDWNQINGSSYNIIEVDTSVNFNSSIKKRYTDSDGYSEEVLNSFLYNQKYFWRVKSFNTVDSSNWSSVWDFTTDNNQSLVSPSNNSATSVSVNFDWNQINGSSYNIIEVDTSVNFNSSIKKRYTDSDGFDQEILNNFLYNQKYFWRVKCFNSVDSSEWSNVWNFTTKSIPNLAYPSNNLSTGVTVNFDWYEIAGSSYNVLEVDTSNDFNSSIKKRYTDSDGFDEEILNSFLYNKTYYWRVKCFNSVDSSEWSNVWNFTTKSIPTLAYPTNNLSTGVSINFDWYEIAGTSYNVLEVDTTNDFNSSIKRRYTDSDGFDEEILNSFLYNKTYYWRVKCFNSVDSSEWSNVWTFCTGTCSGSIVGLKETAFISSSLFYPTIPADNVLYLYKPLQGVKITNALGQIVYTTPLTENQITLPTLSNGFYLLQDDKGRYQKLVIAN